MQKGHIMTDHPDGLTKRDTFYSQYIAWQCTYLLKKYHFLDEFFQIDMLNGRERIYYHNLPFHIKFEVHHKLPLFAGGENDFRNLCLIDKKLHAFVHATCLTRENCDQIYQGKLKLSDCTPDFAPVTTLQEFFWPSLEKVVELNERNKTELSVDIVREFFDPMDLASVGFDSNAFKDGKITKELLAQVMPKREMTRRKTIKRWNLRVSNLSDEDYKALELIKTGTKVADVPYVMTRHSLEKNTRTEKLYKQKRQQTREDRLRRKDKQEKAILWDLYCARNYGE